MKAVGLFQEKPFLTFDFFLPNLKWSCGEFYGPERKQEVTFSLSFSHHAFSHSLTYAHTHTYTHMHTHTPIRAHTLTHFPPRKLKHSDAGLVARKCSKWNIQVDFFLSEWTIKSVQRRHNLTCSDEYKNLTGNVKMFLGGFSTYLAIMVIFKKCLDLWKPDSRTTTTMSATRVLPYFCP